VRIHFTRADLARTYLADGPDPLWELVNSLQLLQGRFGRTVFGPWRSLLADDLHRANLIGSVRKRLFPVAPHASYFPDLLNPAEAALGAEEGIDAVLHTSRHRLSTEISRLAGGPGTGSWLADLAAGRARSLAELGSALHDYHRWAIEPYWNQLHTWVDSDLTMRRQAVRDGGIDRLLDSFRPMMLWRNPVLEVPGHPSNRDVHLGGRGLRLVPSYFCWFHPITIFDLDLPQVVVYPVEHHPNWLLAQPWRSGNPALVRLLGDTRAAVLRATQGGYTTTELSQRVGVSLAAISHHTGILRGAGLITSRRKATTMLHTLSSLGASLLRHGHENARDRPT
jgi:DNA-binding transcriptional ArsR family regulator